MDSSDAQTAGQVDRIVSRFRVHVCVTIWDSPNSNFRISRCVETAIIPRIGHTICDREWGKAFDCEGSEVVSVGVSLELNEAWVWLEDFKLWSLVEAFPEDGSLDSVVASYFVGFTPLIDG